MISEKKNDKERYAHSFGSGEWACLAGLWHNMGKYYADFQEMFLVAAGSETHIETMPERVDHSTATAIHAIEKFKNARQNI